VVVTGQLMSAGGDGTTAGGAAGAITIVTTGAITAVGTVNAFGGNAHADASATGGPGGVPALQAGGDAVVAGTVRLRGGAATSTAGGNATGGPAAALHIDADGAVRVGGVIDARGGMASAVSAGGTIAGGAAAGVQIGEHAPPTSITILMPVDATGGSGDTAGGKGGTVTPEPYDGNVNVAGARAIDVTGGSSRQTPGVGGLVTGGPRHDPGSGGLHVSGQIVASGGSIEQGASGNGADGGRVDFQLLATDGPVMVDQTGTITVEGGKSGGAGVAGGGGHVWLFTKDGDLTMAGHVSVRGGDAPDPGGSGGLGGMIYFFTDNNHNAITVAKGNLLIAPSGTMDASGGNGDVGGNARSDGKVGGWPVFPVDQENISIFLNCDGAHGETLNWMQNQGLLTSRGVVHNGNGGDIVYHGIGPGQLGTPAPASGNHHPPSGMVDMAGDGTGKPGDYGGE